MKKLLIALLVIALTMSSAQASWRVWGEGWGVGPHWFICQTLGVTDWKWCR
jgi:hypothetical protein